MPNTSIGVPNFAKNRQTVFSPLSGSGVLNSRWYHGSGAKGIVWDIKVTTDSVNLSNINFFGADGRGGRRLIYRYDIYAAPPGTIIQVHLHPGLEVLNGNFTTHPCVVPEWFQFQWVPAGGWEFTLKFTLTG